MKYSPISNGEDNKLVVRIVSINLTDFKASAQVIRGGMIEINLLNSLSGITIIPSQGDEWVVERNWTDWILYSRLPGNNPALTTSPSSGEVRISSHSKLNLISPIVKINKRSENATLASSVTGFITLEALSSGQIFCFGEATLSTNVSSVVPVTLGTFVDFVNPSFVISPSTRRIFNGVAQVSESPPNPSVMMKLERFSSTSTTIVFYTIPNQTFTKIYFNTSWHVDQP